MTSTNQSAVAQTGPFPPNEEISWFVIDLCSEIGTARKQGRNLGKAIRRLVIEAGPNKTAETISYLIQKEAVNTKRGYRVPTEEHLVLNLLQRAHKKTVQKSNKPT